MNNRTASLNRAVGISGVALVALLWSVLLDWHFVLGEWDLTPVQLGIAGLFYAAYFGGWIWALLVAVQSSRRALIVLLVYALLLVAYALMDWLAYCPVTCPRIPLYYLANGANLITGVLATAATVIRLKQTATS